ncbi:MAG: cation:dicarboxylase symporter family transporter [Cloacibacterium normanense]
MKHVVPKSVFEAFATNEVLQIVLFSIMFGIALSHLGDRYSKPVIKFLDVCAHAILKIMRLYYVVRSTWCFGSYCSSCSNQWF